MTTPQKNIINAAAWNNFSHDAKNPMMAIYTLLELLSLDNVDFQAPKVKNNIEICKSQLTKLKFVVGNFADIQRLDTLFINKQEEDIIRLLDLVKGEYLARLKMEQHKFKVSKGKIKFVVDANIFKQMISNMIEHFMLFSEKGSISQFYCSLESQNKLIIQLQYHGAGLLTSSELEEIFLIESAIVDKKKGIKYNKGLGLTYNKIMAQYLGGDFQLLIDEANLSHTLQLKLLE